MTTHFWAVPKIGTPAIQIDIEPEALGRNYPLAASVQRRRQGGACGHARAGRQGERRKSARPGSRKFPRCAANGTPNTNPRWNRTACRSIRRGSAPSSPSMCRTTPSSWSTPAMPACGWAACTICACRRRAISAAPAISAGRFRPGIGAKAACPDRPVMVFTGDAGFWYHIAEVETAVRWKHQQHHGRQQQRRRQPVEARLRPRLWRRADATGRANCGPTIR